VVQVLEEGEGWLIPLSVSTAAKLPTRVRSVTRSRSESGAVTVLGPTRAAVNCR
jgi:hypothetical protein